jgi:hypothetical protein
MEEKFKIPAAKNLPNSSVPVHLRLFTPKVQRTLKKERILV